MDEPGSRPVLERVAGRDEIRHERGWRGMLRSIIERVPATAGQAIDEKRSARTPGPRPADPGSGVGSGVRGRRAGTGTGEGSAPRAEILVEALGARSEADGPPVHVTDRAVPGRHTNLRYRRRQRCDRNHRSILAGPLGPSVTTAGQHMNGVRGLSKWTKQPFEPLILAVLGSWRLVRGQFNGHDIPGSRPVSGVAGGPEDQRCDAAWSSEVVDVPGSPRRHVARCIPGACGCAASGAP